MQFKYTLFILFISTFLLSTAQSEETTEVDITDEAVISTNRIQTPLSEKASNVILIDHKELTNLPGITLTDKLHNINGLDLRSRGPHGVQTDLGLRGSTFDQVLVLINGIRMNDVQTGHHIMNLPVDAESIDRVEIHFGSAARVFGQGAYAGAINIITKLSTEDYLKVRISGGENNLMSGGVSGNIATQKTSHYLSGEYNSSDGYKFNTDYEIINLFYNSILNTQAGKFNLMAGYTSRKFGANGFYASPDFQDQYEEVRTSMASLSFSPDFQNSNVQFNAKLYWRNNLDDYVFLRENPSFFNNVHTNNQLGAEIHSTIKTKLGTTGIGAEYQYAHIESNNLGERTRDVVSVFLEHKFTLLENKLSVTPGVQYNSFTDFGENLLPGVDMAYYVSSNSKIYFNAGQTFRIPNYTDLFYEDSANSSNSDLLPELALSQDLGYKTKIKQNWELELVAFRRHSENLIDRVKETEDDKWTPENISDLTSTGASAFIKYSAKESTNLVNHISLGYTYLDSDITTGDNFTSRFNLENLRHQFTSSITFKYIPKLTHTISYRYVERVNLPSYNLVDTRVSYAPSKKWMIGVNVSNLLSENYRETNLVELPLRWISAELSYKFMK